MPLRSALPVTVIAAAALFAACSPTTDSSPPEPTPTTSSGTPTTATSSPVTAEIVVAEGTPWTVSGPVSGNRVLLTSGEIQGEASIDVPLNGTPLWVVGAATATGVVWVVALDDGRLEAWTVDSGRPVSVDLNISELPVGTPPVVVATAEAVNVVAPPIDASPHSYPLPISDGGLAYVTVDGKLAVQAGSQRQEYDIAALPDARVTQSNDGLLAILADATTRYPHGVLGDDLEAGRLVIVDPKAGAIVGEATLAAPAVIEGIAALWADIDGDGKEELLATASDAAVGAQLVVFDRDGSQVAAGPPIGRGNRWRNQLGAGPFGPNGEIEVIDVRVPHIGGVVEFFRLDGSELVFETQVQGHTSHVFGSRNLDMALAADVTGDARLDVVVPTQQLTTLSVLSRDADGADVASQLPLPGTLTTNLAGAVTGDGQLVLAAGTTEGVLRIWASG